MRSASPRSDTADHPCQFVPDSERPRIDQRSPAVNRPQRPRSWSRHLCLGPSQADTASSIFVTHSTPAQNPRRPPALSWRRSTDPLDFPATTEWGRSAPGRLPVVVMATWGPRQPLKDREVFSWLFTTPSHRSDVRADGFAGWRSTWHGLGGLGTEHHHLSESSCGRSLSLLSG